MVYKALYIIILLHIQCNMLCILCLPISLSSLKLTPKPMQALNTQIPPALAIQDTLQAYGTMSGCVSLLELAQTSSPLLSSPSSLYIFNISFFSFYLSKVSNTDLNLSVGSRGWANAASSPAQHSEHNHSDSNTAANMPVRWHFRLLILSTTVSGTRPRDDLGLHKAYPAQYAYFIPLFHSYILSIKGPSSCGRSLESRIWYCWV